jgi:hypothetical protein
MKEHTDATEWELDFDDNEWERVEFPLTEPSYGVEDWLDDMAEFSGLGYYDDDGKWVWVDEEE